MSHYRPQTESVEEAAERTRRRTLIRRVLTGAVGTILLVSVLTFTALWLGFGATALVLWAGTGCLLLVQALWDEG